MSAAPVFSAASIAGCIFTVLVSIALPVAALAVLKRKTGRGLLAALVGAGCFIGYALVLEQLLHAAVFSLFPAITLYPAAYTAYGCLAAGLFEETGRLMGLSLLCKKDRDLALGVGYGIGHGRRGGCAAGRGERRRERCGDAGRARRAAGNGRAWGRGGGRVLGCRCRTHRGNGAAYGAVHPGVDGGHPARSHLVLFRGGAAACRGEYSRGAVPVGAAAEHVVQ